MGIFFQMNTRSRMPRIFAAMLALLLLLQTLPFFVMADGTDDTEQSGLLFSRGTSRKWESRNISAKKLLAEYGLLNETCRRGRRDGDHGHSRDR